MAEPSPTRERWRFGATYAALVFGLMLIHLVPLSVGPGRIPGPDLLICITLAWVLRRPHYVPVLLVAGLFLMADILFMRPLGLYAALVVLAVEFLRARASQTREQTFPAEWAMVASVVLVVTLMNRIVLGVMVVEQPAFGLVVAQFIATLLAYPVVVLLSQWVFGVTKMTASEAEARGRA